jgi:hypothetical protein
MTRVGSQLHRKKNLISGYNLQAANRMDLIQISSTETKSMIKEQMEIEKRKEMYSK